MDCLWKASQVGFLLQLSKLWSLTTQDGVQFTPASFITLFFLDILGWVLVIICTKFDRMINVDSTAPCWLELVVKHCLLW